MSTAISDGAEAKLPTQRRTTRLPRTMSPAIKPKCPTRHLVPRILISSRDGSALTASVSSPNKLQVSQTGLNINLHQTIQLLLPDGMQDSPVFALAYPLWHLAVSPQSRTGRYYYSTYANTVLHWLSHDHILALHSARSFKTTYEISLIRYTNAIVQSLQRRTLHRSCNHKTFAKASVDAKAHFVSDTQNAAFNLVKPGPRLLRMAEHSHLVLARSLSPQDTVSEDRIAICSVCLDISAHDVLEASKPLDISKQWSLSAAQPPLRCSNRVSTDIGIDCLLVFIQRRHQGRQHGHLVHISTRGHGVAECRLPPQISANLKPAQLRLDAYRERAKPNKRELIRVTIPS
ncbi:hypothetical protein BKA70DRAFT_1571204 [Coprinopsis sp. MPI-PUGE-AT-0042]|nr:hypothetical protein BKA70DRAFT_1571204 [Coprinopsis sp. MPI-PUGE-AT-0042]